MPAENKELDELRRRTGKLMIRLYVATTLLDRAIDVAPDLASLRKSKARKGARQAMDEFKQWLTRAAVGEEETRALQWAGLSAAVKEDAEQR